MEKGELLEIAIDARKNCYAAYSGFNVGAALLTEDGKVFTGCNIENSSYSITICAERVAMSKAVSEGYTKFKMIAIAGGKDTDLVYCPPCGACRQFMSEFCDDDFEIILGLSGEDYKAFTLGEMLPGAIELKKEIQ